MKKIISLCLAAMLLTVGLVGCGTTNDKSTPSGGSPATASGAISVLSREEGSGTRGAFIELFGIEQKNAEGKKVDLTTTAAEICKSTSVMTTSVEGNKNAIGYVSLGSLQSSVKALKIDGVEATVENIKSGSYAIARPFNIVTKDGLNNVAADFVAFILSTEGQKVVTDNGYIALDNTTAYAGTKPAGTITVAGSSSVTPLMEKLKEAYAAINPNASIKVQQNDSTTGITSAIEGVCDIGMASRELKDSELEKGVKSTTIATDGIAVIVNKDLAIDNLTKDQVMNIFMGNITDWSDIK